MSIKTAGESPRNVDLTRRRLLDRTFARPLQLAIEDLDRFRDRLALASFEEVREIVLAEDGDFELLALAKFEVPTGATAPVPAGRTVRSRGRL